MLEFEDDAEETHGLADGHWPDQPSAEDSQRWLGPGGGVLPSLDHARSIVEFIDRHHRSDQALDLVVHCYAGVSRSAMVVAKAVDWCDLSSSPVRISPYMKPRLGRLLDKAHDELVRARGLAPKLASRARP